MITVTEMAIGEEKEIVADMKEEMRAGDFDGWNVFTGAILPILDRTPVKFDEDK